jgi:FADH2 O2-dependent halogenase
MIEADGDVAVLGSSFAGSLMALILERIGLRPLLVDKSAHPRFALGESTTPIANMVLRDLTIKYDLPRLLPLTRYGTWQRELPHLVCGRKRGFSFFEQKSNEEFRPYANHANELLVTASRDDERCDTHWLRADVDAYFAAEVERNGIRHLDRTALSHIERSGGGKHWVLHGSRNDEPVRMRADFLIDSTGDGGLLGRTFQIPPAREEFRTNSRVLYAHFSGTKRWRDLMADAACSVDDHPFDCDDAAVHHIFDGGWMWQLPFNNGVTSAGLVFDGRRHRFDESVPAEEEWNRWLLRHPSMAEQFSRAEIVGPKAGQLVRTKRLQRRWSSATGPNWVMLPQTVGVIDALFSTGIAQSLCGIERLADIFARDWKSDRLVESLQEYETAVFSELAFVDELVGGCFDIFGRFELFAPFSMLYFAAATTYEQRRLERGNDGMQFLCADDAGLRMAVAKISQRVLGLRIRSNEVRRGEHILDADEFFDDVAAAIAPFNAAGLCERQAQNMYRYTAPDE